MHACIIYENRPCLCLLKLSHQILCLAWYIGSSNSLSILNMNHSSGNRSFWMYDHQYLERESSRWATCRVSELIHISGVHRGFYSWFHGALCITADTCMSLCDVDVVHVYHAFIKHGADGCTSRYDSGPGFRTFFFHFFLFCFHFHLTIKRLNSWGSLS